MFHKVKEVCALPKLTLCAQFSEGVTKIYDLKPLLSKWPAFSVLEQEKVLFCLVTVDVGGYGIVWNDDR